MGDLMCALPALSDLKQAVPSCELTLIALPMVRELARRVPFVDRVLPFPGFPGIAEQLFRPRAALSFFEHMQAERFDLAVQMHGSGAYSNPFTLMLGARRTVGFTATGRSAALLDAVLPLPEDLPEVERCRALVSMLGAPSTEAGDYLHLLPADHSHALLLLGPHPRPWMGIHAGARDPHKMWPMTRYLRVAERLVGETGGTVFLLGSREDAVELAAHSGSSGGEQRAGRDNGGMIGLAGTTSLPQLAAVVAGLDVFVGNDSGPAHMAYALGIPSVTIFGGTDPERWGPRAWPEADLGRHRVVARPALCRPCEPGDCDRANACLEEVDADLVAEQVLELISLEPTVPAVGRRPMRPVPKK
jgi:ADP-heptose:LPS heptosyltransferase